MKGAWVIDWLHIQTQKSFANIDKIKDIISFYALSL
jgi:hypothetical protein